MQTWPYLCGDDSWDPRSGTTVSVQHCVGRRAGSCPCLHNSAASTSALHKLPTSSGEKIQETSYLPSLCRHGDSDVNYLSSAH